MKNGGIWQLQKLKPTSRRLTEKIREIGADPYAERMWEKGVSMPILVQNVRTCAANIIKQEALASGIDAAVCRGAVSCAAEYTDVLICGSVRGVKILAERLKRQPFDLKRLGEQVEKLLADEKSSVWFARGRKLPLENVQVMGILNITPDSFSDGGRYIGTAAIDARIEQILDEGATIIDVGGVSTRPGFTEPTPAEEIHRIEYAIRRAVSAAHGRGVFVSADTYRYEVAKMCADLGVDIINDQLGLTGADMAELCATEGLGVCIMSRGNLNEIKKDLANKCAKALSVGILPESLVLDPGFGFGKTVADNYSVLQYMSELCSLGYPLLAGVSNKSMIGNATGRDVADRVYGTIAAEFLAMMNGAAIIRTHNVAACADAANVYKMCRS